MNKAEKAILKALEDAYTEKYKNLEKENLKPTQVAFIIFGIETFHSCLLPK